MDESTPNYSEWAVALVDSSRTVMGQVEDFGDAFMMKREVICFSHALDFFSPLQSFGGPGEEPRVGRVPMIMAFEFTLQPCKVYVRWKTLYFLADMHGDDFKVYSDFIGATLKGIQNTRVKRAGLVLPGVTPITKNAKSPFAP